jgi:hypothetical protein
MAFDLTVDHRNPKNGRIEKTTPYTRYSSPHGVIYARDGVFYTESGHVAPDDLVAAIVGREVVQKKPEAKKW